MCVIRLLVAHAGAGNSPTIRNSVVTMTKAATARMAIDPVWRTAGAAMGAVDGRHDMTRSSGEAGSLSLYDGSDILFMVFIPRILEFSSI